MTINRLGLQRGKVKFGVHAAEWKFLFAGEQERLFEALGERMIDIHHIGSAAVLGLDAKPIIDITVGLADLAGVSDCVPRLEKAGYT